MRKVVRQRKKQNLQDTIISVVLVTQNDEDIIQRRIRGISTELEKLQVNYEILIVDNASEDNTVDTIRKLHKDITNIRILILSKQNDTEIALTAGIDNCIGDYAILLNIYTDPPTVLPKIVKELLNNNDIVIGKMKKDPFSYNIASRFFIHLLEKISTHHFEYRTNYLIGLNRKVINSITRTRRKSRNFSYLNNLIGYKKNSIYYTPIVNDQKKMREENFISLFFTVSDIIISNSFKPIRVFSFLGILASILFLVYAFGISIIYFFINPSIAPKGWISLAVVMGGMFFLLFSLLSLIAEYIIRTLHETRNEPLYFISDEIDKSIILAEQDRLNIV